MKSKSRGQFVGSQALGHQSNLELRDFVMIASIVG